LLRIASNVIAYENEDVIESSFVDEDERSGKQKKEMVIYYINNNIIIFYHIEKEVTQ
jgi:hypothetical protein